MHTTESKDTKSNSKKKKNICIASLSSHYRKFPVTFQFFIYCCVAGKDLDMILMSGATNHQECLLLDSLPVIP